MQVRGTSRVADAVRSPVHFEQARQLPVSSHQFFDLPQSLCVVQWSPSLPSATVAMMVLHIRAERARLTDIAAGGSASSAKSLRAWPEDGAAPRVVVPATSDKRRSCGAVVVWAVGRAEPARVQVSSAPRASY
eukprot:4380293-Prymnesium_polylepis.1